MADQEYLVTARKYRPSLFREVVAQGHVTDTLKNAIRLDRVAHAYLFSGPRGVGKTTAARILAKAINCQTPREEREDGAEPCCECESCRTFEQGGSLNVFELDAASNRKVGDVEPLLEKVTIPPQGGRKKVYIIDEVHMFSKHAFNALLKTLEEPPDHALFIFATTEPNEVIPTVRSRCQRFDFRRIPVPEVVDHLRGICEAEGIEADEESLILLARKGNGALRDALSAFDQAISLCGSTLEYSDLTEALGVVDQDLYFDLTGHVATQDTAGVLKLVRHVVRSGYDLQEFLAGAAEHLRNLLVVHSLGGDALEGVAESTRSQYVEEAERFGEADLLRLLTVAGDAQDEVKNSPQPRLKLETTLLKMAQMRRTADLREVLQKIDRLEQMAEAGEIPESLAGAGTSTPEEAPESEATERQTEEATPEAAEPTPSYASEAPGETASPADAESPPAAPTATEPEDADEEEAPPADEEMPPTDETEDEAEDRDPDSEDSGSDGGAPADPGAEEADDSSVEYNDLFGTPALDGGSDAGGDGASDTSTDAQGDRSSSDGGGGPQAAVAEPAVESATTGAEGLAQRWPQFVQAVKGERISLGSLLGETEPVELRNEVLTVAVPKPLHRDTLRDQRRFLLGQLTATFEVAIEDMEFVVEEAESDPEDATDGTDPVSPREQLQQLRDTYPSLDVLFGEFGAEPVW
jgi:DNA polymerase-3 subunit gamma/tau